MKLEFSNIGHRYGSVQALVDIDLSISAGDITCLLGPSGCGKTTLLHLAAGLQDVQQGEIQIDGETLASAGHNPPPEKRPVGLVFQEGALFPHMTVAQNVGFGLQSKDDRQSHIAQWLAHIGLQDFGDRFPHMLSGGQQQRVALARAMAAKPGILLMDEPFANIDVVLRRELRAQTRSILKDSGTTAIIVTHDPQEAVEMGDKIAVMEQGRIAQYGTPDELYEAPASAEIGAMIGGGQIIVATLKQGTVETAFGSWPDECLKNKDILTQDTSGRKAVTLLISPAALHIDTAGKSCQIIDIRRSGDRRHAILAADNGERIIAEISREETAKTGERVDIICKPGQILAFSATP